MANSRFASHVRLWLIVSPLMICTLAPFMQNDRAFEISEAEQASVERVLGQERADIVVSLANARFHKWFIDSGAVKASFTGSDGQTSFSDGGAAAFGRGWMQHFWLTIYRAVYRAAVAHHWVLGAIVLLVALFNDGTVSRKIRAAGAGFANPVTFHVAAHGLTLCFGFGTSALLLPLPMLATWWTFGVCLIGLLCWRLAASFHVGK
ncbi:MULTISPECIES: DUF4400 domain-containing protein [Cupriavidus]|uniref:DUF4400 domain-containing protein n=3 Tax=Cupriavidus TaxID=106589 RepID=A0A375HWX5_9BURK|nr:MULTISPECIES: DUF4400 domain-containing protein [Cupriavidus]MCO4865643.1 DUF4400 domain-containing protein [Cupriavidus sp. WGlv3]MCO4893403.1 DUF4400 domain-containing protein [Cupriavidus sp. WGtm5]ULX56145.1 hypothetical protein A9P79_29750 [Cupriavidus taiwanensis]CAP63906.1 conserved hypothetical protein; putative membrane protein [Cupriavidus taiwanensis LMG 19424]SOY74253.1 conserved hypothetical protein; putative membrane protein [Cupriavidus taiwanensis]